jgi:polysaccharide export outer membrane protein
MGRSVSLFLVRASSILVAGMLLFAVFGRAHAENLDGYGLVTPGPATDSAPYGLKPLPGAPAGGSGYAAVPTGSFTPVPQQQMAAAYQSAPQPATPYGYRADLPATAQPAPLQPAPYAAPQSSVPYGYRADMTPAAPAYPQAPAYPSATRLPASAYAYYQPQQPTSEMRSNPDYVLSTGDKVKLTVFGETDLSGDFAIDGSGNLALPLIGQVRAAGYTAAQLEGVVRNAFMQGYLKSPRVSIEVSTYRRFYIIGAVNRPGQYPYVDHMNAMNAIALAGGFTPTAVESTIFLRREGSNEEVEVPVDRTTEIRPGDVVKVHNTLFSDITSWISPISGVAASAATAAIIQLFCRKAGPGLDWGHERPRCPQTQFRRHAWSRRQCPHRQWRKARHHRRALPVGKPQPRLRHGGRAEGGLRQAGRGAGLQDQLRQGQPHQRQHRARHRAGKRAADLRRRPESFRPAGADRRA